MTDSKNLSVPHRYFGHGDSSGRVLWQRTSDRPNSLVEHGTKRLLAGDVLCSVYRLPNRDGDPDGRGRIGNVARRGR